MFNGMHELHTLKYTFCKGRPNCCIGEIYYYSEQTIPATRSFDLETQVIEWMINISFSLLPSIFSWRGLARQIIFLGFQKLLSKHEEGGRDALL